MQTPVVFIIFNRVDTARRVFNEIRRVRPSRLFVIADGPREDRKGEKEKCEQARAIINEIDWPCEVLTNYSSVNLGCRQRVSSGIDWVFSHTERAIILEDDCLPHPVFFPFCETLLDRYADDERIMHIAGTNYQFGRRRFPYSYYFSRYNHCWGWATWKRAWRCYDANMSLWPEFRDLHLLPDLLNDRRAASYWERSFQHVFDRKIDSWSYVWTFSCWMQGGLTILPSVNLISNIGFNPEGSHTINRRSKFANMPVQSLELPLIAPPFVIRDSEADRFTQRNNFRTGMLASLGRWLLQLYHRSN